jgi:hypothetical protein
MSEEKVEKKKKGRPKLNLTPRETISRERVRQIQETALGRLRRVLYARGITSMKDFLE